MPSYTSGPFLDGGGSALLSSPLARGTKAADTASLAPIQHLLEKETGRCRGHRGQTTSTLDKGNVLALSLRKVLELARIPRSLPASTVIDMAVI